MNLIDDQFRTVNDADEQATSPLREDREARYDRDGLSLNIPNDVFNQNSLLKKLMQQEVSEGM